MATQTSPSRTRLGVDIGGTFTDLVLETRSGFFSEKLMTTQQAPEEAILEGIGKIISRAGIEASDLEMIIHGTTLATNALIQRNGAKTALITTEGFRDVIEMRTENRFEQYDINLTLPAPLIERRHRYTIRERLSAQGDVLRALDPDDVNALVDLLKARSYESIAIGLIHAYTDGRHERIIRHAIEEAMPGISVSISSEVSPQMREYERFSTVCANAWVRPKIQSYLLRLTQQLGETGATCPLYLMHSGGGLISVGDAMSFPVRLIESGPAGGAIFAADIARAHGIAKALSFDMGGTTAKICMIRDATPKTANAFEVARSYRFKKGSGMPISIPVIEMVEIGAGGGSIAHVDSMRQIRVGPQSAESDPGPACYDRGGKNPTVTDGDLLLGKLDADNFAGGTIRLSFEKATSATLEKLGHPLGLDATQSAFGLCEVIDENMANAARIHAVENGEDLSEFSMIAFGGAAPLHAARLCEKLNMDSCLIPSGAGVGSAIGFLKAPFAFEAVRSDFQRLSGLDLIHVQELARQLVNEAGKHVSGGDAGEATVVLECKAFMRYTGQGWEIPVYLDIEKIDDWNRNYLTGEFEKEYETLFGRTVADLDIEITGWAARESRISSGCGCPQMQQNPNPQALSGDRRRPIFSVISKTFVDAALYQRDQIQSGQIISGPGVITENETTVIVPEDFDCRMENDRSLLIRRQKPDPAPPGPCPG